MKNSYLNEVIPKLEKIKSDVRMNFEHLSPEQLNFKSSIDKWSIGQCLDHLIVSNKSYFPELNGLQSGTIADNIMKHIPLLPKFFGRMLYNSLKPDTKRKLKAPKVFTPSFSSISSGIINDFEMNQDELIGIARNSDFLNHEKTIITSPASKFVVYNLKDCFRILTVHEERHFNQAMRILSGKNFPDNL